MKTFSHGALDAFKRRNGQPGGYRFQIIGDPDDDLLILLGRLIEKIRRVLSAKHLTDGNLGLQVADRVVRAFLFQLFWSSARAPRVGSSRCA